MSDVFDQFRRDFFPETERQALSFEILSEDWQALKTLFAENDWTDDDGLRYTLAAGQAYLEGTAHLAALQHPDADLAGEVARLLRERMHVESCYGVMKYRAYTFMQAAQLMEMKLNACGAELDGLRNLNEQLRQQLNQA